MVAGEGETGGGGEISGRDVQVLIDLACFSVFPEQPPQDPLSPHPLHFGGQTGLGGTLSFTRTCVTAFALGGQENACAGTRVHDGGLYDDAAVLDEFLDMRARIGVGDLCLFSGIKPDFAFADTGDGGGEPLLRA